MAKDKKPKSDAGSEKSPPLSRDRKVRRAFSSQASCVPGRNDFTEAELDGFAALVNDDGTFVAGIREKFQELWRAHRERLRAAAKPQTLPEAAKR